MTRPQYRVKPPHPRIEPRYFRTLEGARNAVPRILDQLWFGEPERRVVLVQYRDDPTGRDWVTLERVMQNNA